MPPPGNAPPTWPISPRSSPPSSRTAPPGAAPAASPTPASPASNGSPDFSTDAVPAITPALLAGLATGAYLDNGEPAVLPGDSGTGKTHLLTGLGLAACEQGRRARYATTAALDGELVEAADQRALSRVVGRYARLDLLLPGELGYVQVDPRGAGLLFQITTEQDERASIAIGTNLPFSEWGAVFPDPRLVAAIVDRVTFNAHILETGTRSYRLRTSTTTSRSKSPAKSLLENRPTGGGDVSGCSRTEDGVSLR